MPLRVGQQYAQTSDLYGVISQAALNHPSTNSTTVQNAALLKASEEVDDALCNQFILPLAAVDGWGSDIIQRTCDIAAYRLVCLRGFNPETDGHFRANYEDAQKWLALVANGKMTPNVTDSSPAAAPGVPSPSAQPGAESPAPIRPNGRQTRGTNRR